MAQTFFSQIILFFGNGEFRSLPERRQRMAFQSRVERADSLAAVQTEPSGRASDASHYASSDDGRMAISVHFPRRIYVVER